MGQRGAGWTDTSQDAMDSAAREHQERMAAKTAYLKVQIILEQARKLQATLVRNYRLLTHWRGWSVELLAELKKWLIAHP